MIDLLADVSRPHLEEKDTVEKENSLRQLAGVETREDQKPLWDLLLMWREQLESLIYCKSVNGRR